MATYLSPKTKQLGWMAIGAIALFTAGRFSVQWATEQADEIRGKICIRTDAQRAVNYSLIWAYPLLAESRGLTPLEDHGAI